MKTIWSSLLLAFQFFTVLPVQKELSLNRATITGMFACLPWIGTLMGATVAVVLYGLTQWTASSDILLAFIVLGLFALWTGGLHLDGFIDMGDAYFSYRDREKRLEILDDPRVGAFGVLAVLFLLLGKFVILHELFVQQQFALWMAVFVPFLTRIGMSLYFLSLKCAKDKGLAYYFQSHIHAKALTGWMLVSLILGLALVLVITKLSIVPVILVVVLALALLLFRQFTVRNFGGVSGDLLGASIEGMEVVLWVTLLLCA